MHRKCIVVVANIHEDWTLREIARSIFKLEEHEGRIKQVIVFRKNLNKVFNSYHFAPQNKVKCWTTIYLSKILYKVKYI